jgi:hypothetical protein
VIKRRQATLHRHGQKRGAPTSITPNSEVRRRGRRTLSGRCAPHRSQRHRLRQCSSTCAATRWRCTAARTTLPSSRPKAQRRCGMAGWDALARAALVPLRRAARPSQLQHDPPPHRAPTPQPPATDIALSKSGRSHGYQERISLVGAFPCRSSAPFYPNCTSLCIETGSGHAARRIMCGPA